MPEPSPEHLLVLDRIATALERLVKIECLKASSTVDAMEQQYVALSEPTPDTSEPEYLLQQSEAEVAAQVARFEEYLRRGYRIAEDTDLDDPAELERLVGG